MKHALTYAPGALAAWLRHAAGGWPMRRLMAVATLLLAGAGTAFAQVTIPGSYSVGDNGAATYTVPIAVPPGIAGMEPKLSLNYSSLGGNGPVGLGWNLGGISTITRCTMNKARDGSTRAIAWDSADPYCLNGTRLVPVRDPANSGAAVLPNGGNGTFYAAEQENFSKVQSFTDPANAGGAAYFIVKTKAGLTMEYGRTSDSRIEAQGRSAVRVWALNKVIDSKGNYFTVSYYEDTDNSQYYPRRIDYTQHDVPAVTAANRVDFDYGSWAVRGDPLHAYVGDSLVRTNHLLHGIKVYAGALLVREYGLTYMTSEGTGRSLLYQIDLKGSLGASVQPTRFAWTSANTSRFTDNDLAVSNAYGGWVGASSRLHVVDFDGDGKQDIIVGPDGSGTWSLLQSNGSGFTDKKAVAQGKYGNWDGSADRIHVMDIDGDGRSDFVLGPDANGNWYWLQSDGSNLIERPKLISGAYANWAGASDRVRVVDINGDGRQDLLIGPDGGGNWYALQSDGASFINRGAIVTGQFGNWDGLADRIRMMDVNGDGLQDVVLGPDANGTWWWLRATDNGYEYGGKLITAEKYRWGSGLQSLLKNQIRVMDVNGDGLQDLMLGPDYGGVFYWLQSTGSTLVDRGQVLESPYAGWANESSRIRANDNNGDGYKELLIGPDGAGNWYGLRSTGDALVNENVVLPSKYGSWDGAADRIRLMDVNGDGNADIVLGPDVSGNWYWLAATPPSEVISSVATSGHLSGDIWTLLHNTPTEVYFTYARLTDPTVYTKGSDATYPLVDVQSPMQVVSRVSSKVAGLRFSVSNQTDFTYGGLRMNYAPNARGSQGFRWVQSRQVNTGLVSRTYFRQDFPFTGMAEKNGKGTSAASWSNLSLTTYGYLCRDFVSAAAASCAVAPGKRYFVYAGQSDEQGWDLDGSALPWTRTTQTMDDWGNPTSITVATLNPDGSASDHAKTTTNVYSQDLNNWYLGRLTRSTVSVSAPATSPPVLALSGGPANPPSAAMLQALQALPVIMNMLLED